MTAEIVLLLVSLSLAIVANVKGKNYHRGCDDAEEDAQREVFNPRKKENADYMRGYKFFHRLESLTVKWNKERNK